jgi:O-antigen ligase
MSARFVILQRKGLTSLSPAYLAFLILFGMILAFAIVSVLGLEWHAGITVTLYSAALAWSVLLTWARRRDLPRWGSIDLFLVLFILAILTSIVLHGRERDLFSGAARYLPFLLVAPYLCGRLMARRDIELFVRLLGYGGLAILPILLWDAHASPVASGRQTFFGMNHTPLLIGGFLAFSLLAIGARTDDEHFARRPRLSRIVQYTSMGLVAGFMIWVSARGWVVGVIVGFLVLVVGGLWTGVLGKAYLRRLLFVIAAMVLTLSIFPHLHDFYGRLILDASTRLDVHSGVGSILGPSSCGPVIAGVDSVAIRWVLYREAVAQFFQAPLLGTGAGLFGERSCLGAGGFPHSTLLQSFAELGVVGGIVYLALFAVAMFTLLRRIGRDTTLAGRAPLLLVLSLLVTDMVADQIYGDYFMASGTYFMLGLIVAMEKQARGDVAG